MQVNEAKNLGDESGELKTGRSLDAAIAERVMGRKVVWSAAIYGDWMDRTSGRSDVRVSRYSADIAAAMQVVEHVAAPGIHFMSDYLVQRNGQKRWFAQFLRDGLTDGLHNEWIEAPTLQEAICRAALALVNKPDTNSANSDHPADGQASKTEVQK